jgi:hypothetical protein
MPELTPPRNASSTAKGAGRGALAGLIGTAAGAYVLSQTGSPALAAAAENLTPGAIGTALSVGAGVVAGLAAAGKWLRNRGHRNVPI